MDCIVYGTGLNTVYGNGRSGEGTVSLPWWRIGTVFEDVRSAVRYVVSAPMTGQNRSIRFWRWGWPVVISKEETGDMARAFRRGEIWAFRRAAEEYFGPIANFLAHLVGSSDTAEDLAQEAFFAAFRSHHTFRENAPLAPWIFRIARNLAYKELKRKERRLHSSLDEIAEVDGIELSAEEPTPRESSVAADLAERINRALSRIQPDYRDAVILRLLQGYSGEEASTLLAIPVATVNTRVHRGIRQLRIALQREGIDESWLPK